MAFPRAIALLTAIVATGGVILQFTLTVIVTDRTLIDGFVRYVSYMTNWNAVAGMMVAWATVTAPTSRLGGPVARTAMAALMIVVIVLYEALLRGREGDVTLAQRIATDIQHDALPILFVAMWALSRHPGLAWRSAAWAMVLPLAYLVFGLARGLVADFWGYWFLNLPELGLIVFVRNCVSVLALFAFMGLVLVAIDRRLARPARPTH